MKIAIADVKIFGGRRSLQDDKVRIIADSMRKIGLKTPITVTRRKTGIRLVTGLHRVEAAKLLGWKKFDAFLQPGGKNDANLWEDSENLHRAELTALERAVRIEAWRKATRKKAAQLTQPGGKQPKDSGIAKTSLKPVLLNGSHFVEAEGLLLVWHVSKAPASGTNVVKRHRTPR